MTLAKIIVWILTGALAGTLAGRIVTRSKQGLGIWMNLAAGMVGALVGGGLFWVFGIDLRLGEIHINAQDLLAALIGALICIYGWRMYQKKADAKVAPGKK